MSLRVEPSYDPNLVIGASGYLNDLLDVTSTGAFDGALIVYSSAVTGWIIGSGTSATGSLNSLSDVDIDSPVANRAIIYNGSNWVQGYPSGAITLTSGMVLANLATKQFLVYDGTNFINRSGGLADLSGVNITGVASGQVLSYQGAVLGWIPGNGVTGGVPSTLNDLSDVSVASVGSGQVLGYEGAVLGWIPVDRTGELVTQLGQLSDVNTSGTLETNMWLGYNGSYWRQSYFDTTNLFNVTGHGLVAQDHALVYQTNIGKYISTHIITAPTGLINGSGDLINNTNVLQSSLNRGGIIFLPSGTYPTSGIYMNVNGTRLIGPGILVSKSGDTSNAILTISGSNCFVQGISLDSNSGERPIPAGRGEGLRVVGNYNYIDNVRIYNLPTGGLNANGLEVFGEHNVFSNMWISGGTTAAYRNRGSNTYNNIVAIDYGYKGFSQAGAGDELRVNGFYSDVTKRFYDNGRAGFQIDPGAGEYLNRAYLNNITTNGSYTGSMFAGDCGMKIALVGDFYLTNSCLGHGTGTTDSLVIAEDINTINIDNTSIACCLNSNTTAGQAVPDNYRITNCRFGMTGYNQINSHIFDLEFSGTAIIDHCTFRGFLSSAIDINGDSGTFNKLIITNNEFIGSGASTFDVNTTDTTLDLSNSIVHLNNRRSNIAGGNAFTSSNSGKRRRLSTIDSVGKRYQHDTFPVSETSVGFWHAGDIVYKKGTLATGGIIGWICTNSGSPGDWAPFGNINNGLIGTVSWTPGGVAATGYASTGAPIVGIGIGTGYNIIPNRGLSGCIFHSYCSGYTVSTGLLAMTVFNPTNSTIDLSGAITWNIYRL